MRKKAVKESELIVSEHGADQDEAEQKALVKACDYWGIAPGDSKLTMQYISTLATVEDGKPLSRVEIRFTYNA